MLKPKKNKGNFIPREFLHLISTPPYDHALTIVRIQSIRNLSVSVFINIVCNGNNLQVYIIRILRCHEGLRHSDINCRRDMRAFITDALCFHPLVTPPKFHQSPLNAYVSLSAYNPILKHFHVKAPHHARQAESVHLCRTAAG